MDPITLSNGDQVTLRDPQLIKERHRRQIERAYLSLDDETFDEIKEAKDNDRPVSKDRLTAKDLEFLEHVNDVCVIALIERWTTHDGTVVDATEDQLGELDGQSYADLNGAAASLVELIKLDFSPTPAGGGETPTVPVNA